jgi:preprotein translocase subunit YajC
MSAGALIIIVLLFAVGWALLIRPQRRRQMVQRQMQEELAPGVEILTAGGLYGFVRSIDENDEVTVEIAPGTNVRVARRAVAAIIPPEQAELEPPAEEAQR